MGRLINLSIDLNKIDRSKIVTGQNGQKYYDITVSVNDTADKYNNDVSCWNKQTKDEVTAKATKTYLGNGKTFWQSATEGATAPAAQTASGSESKEDDLPW